MEPTPRPGLAAAGTAHGAPPFELLIKRNCSMSPRSVLAVVAFTAAVCFSIGAVFAWHGLWLVLPFAGLEVVAVAAAFYVSGLHAGDYEHYWLESGVLVLEIRDGARVSSRRFQTAWARVILEEGLRDTRLALAQGGEEVRIGRHLPAPARGMLAQRLKQALRAAAATG